MSLYAFEGQCDGNTIENCSINENEDYGVLLNSECDGNTIRVNTISKNNNSGIWLYYADGNRVEANHVSGTTADPSYGIRDSNSENNVILKNTCIGQTNNFLLGNANTYGPIVTNTGALATSGAGAHPWANFSR